MTRDEYQSYMGVYDSQMAALSGLENKLHQRMLQKRQEYFKANEGQGCWTPFFLTRFRIPLKGMSEKLLSYLKHDIAYEDGDEYALGTISGQHYHNDGTPCDYNRLYHIQWSNGQHTLSEPHVFQHAEPIEGELPDPLPAFGTRRNSWGVKPG